MRENARTLTTATAYSRPCDCVLSPLRLRPFAPATAAFHPCDCGLSPLRLRPFTHELIYVKAWTYIRKGLKVYTCRPFVNVRADVCSRSKSYLFMSEELANQGWLASSSRSKSYLFMSLTPTGWHNIGQGVKPVKDKSAHLPSIAYCRNTLVPTDGLEWYGYCSSCSPQQESSPESRIPHHNVSQPKQLSNNVWQLNWCSTLFLSIY